MGARGGLSHERPWCGDLSVARRTLSGINVGMRRAWLHLVQRF
jgi:hypothetical protein